MHHTIVDMRTLENGQIIFEEHSKDRVFNPLEVRCLYLDELIGKYGWLKIMIYEFI